MRNANTKDDSLKETGRCGAGTNAIQAMLIDRPTDKELHRICAELESILKLAPELSASIEHVGQYHHEMSTRFDIDFPECNDYESNEETLEPLRDAFKEVSRDLMRWIYKNLEGSYEYTMSDESVDDSMRANEYEFTEEGDIS